MRVYRNSEGYIVTYTPDDVEAFDPDVEPGQISVVDGGYISPLVGVHGFFEFDRSGNLQGMDNHQPAGRALAAFAVHCRDFAEREFQLDSPGKEDLERLQVPHEDRYDHGGLDRVVGATHLFGTKGPGH